jgi:hypothetical protein
MFAKEHISSGLIVKALLCFYLCFSSVYIGAMELTEKDVANIALNYLRDREEWKCLVVVDINGQTEQKLDQCPVETKVMGLGEDGNWEVIIWRLPKTFGGHRYIVVDQKGKVIQYELGE